MFLGKSTTLNRVSTSVFSSYFGRKILNFNYAIHHYGQMSMVPLVKSSSELITHSPRVIAKTLNPTKSIKQVYHKFIVGWAVVIHNKIYRFQVEKMEIRRLHISLMCLFNINFD